MKNIISKLFGLSRESGLLLMVSSVIISIVSLVLSEGWYGKISFIENIQSIYLFAIYTGDLDCTGYVATLYCGDGIFLTLYYRYVLLLMGLGFILGLNGFLMGDTVKVVKNSPLED